MIPLCFYIYSVTYRSRLMSLLHSNCRLKLIYHLILCKVELRDKDLQKILLIVPVSKHSLFPINYFTKNIYAA